MRTLCAILLMAEARAEESDESAATPPVVVAPSPNMFNPTLTIVGNGLYRWDDRPVVTSDGDRLDNRFGLREVELDARAAVDPFADGLAIIALEAETPGQYELDVEEGYVTVKRLPVWGLEEPPLGLKLRVGRMRADLGRANLLHTHDLPWSYRPLAISEFLGEEGTIGDGASARFFVPFPWDEDSAVEMSLQAFSGGASRITEDGTNAPELVANLRWFRSFADAHSVDLTAILHQGSTTPGNALAAWLVSGEALYKWKPLRQGESRSLVLAGQVLTAHRRAVVENTQQLVQPLGWFAWMQLQPWRTVYVGGRYDDTQTLDDAAVSRRAASGTASWYPSEFLRFRAGYERRFSDLPEEDRRNSVFVDVNFVMGAHPPEPFWVNR